MDDGSFSGLLCQESDHTFLDEEETFSDLKSQSVADDEYVKMLADKEISFGFKRDKSFVLSQEIECARLDSIAWILKTRASFGFRSKTAYLSVTYLDRFLSRRPIDSEKLWAIKLLSVACLSLAAKMEEVNVPSLTEFQIDEYNFGSSVIQRMELLVLHTLNWRMRSVTPFVFLRYFITKFWNDTPPNDALSRMVALILAAMREINLVDHRPSIIAAAATLVVLDQSLTKNELECKMNSISYGGFLEIEDVLACYIIMQKLDMEKFNTPDSPNLSPTRLRKTSVLDYPTVSSSVHRKRKRLTFDDSDQCIDRPNEKRFC
uniref:Cyclin D5-1 n=1 Tax=Dimocarpus longan TaxID=128017 RepID=A0A8G0QY74_9ROSI|nr:cyclin D5-1 [Dimocarpus longan]